MQVQRTKLSSGFVQIPNVVARHGSLSLEAVGLLTRLLSLPDGSGATVERVSAQVPNGRRSVSAAMNELIKAGFVKRAKMQDPETGRWVTITTVTDTPETATSPTDRFPTVGVATGRAVGGSPIGRKTENKKNITPTPVQAPEEVQEAAPTAPESTEKGGEGESTFLDKIGREMAREARRILERLSLHKSLPLSDQEIARLSPKVLPWLREDYRSDEILQCLTAKLPEQVDSVPGLISHRLKSFTPVRSIPQQVSKPSMPVQRAKCEVCEAPFRLGHEGGVCRTCKGEMDRAAAALGVGTENSF
jgi:predicted transcriptional regulator